MCGMVPMFALARMFTCSGTFSRLMVSGLAVAGLMASRMLAGGAATPGAADDDELMGTDGRLLDVFRGALYRQSDVERRNGLGQRRVFYRRRQYRDVHGHHRGESGQMHARPMAAFQSPAASAIRSLTRASGKIRWIRVEPGLSSPDEWAVLTRAARGNNQGSSEAFNNRHANGRLRSQTARARIVE